MKKLLAILGALGLTTTGATAVVACKSSNSNTPTVSKKSISDVNVEDPQTIADDTKTYADLNKDKTIINLVIDAINKVLGLTRNQVTSADFELTNAQTGTDKQAAGTAVEFIVTAKDSSSIIKDNFKFINTLAAPAKKSISDVNVEDPQTVADDTKTYADLNKDKTIINLVIDAINKALGLTRNQVTSADFELTNAQTGTDKQVAGTAVEFIVTAKDSSSIIKDNFKFINTLAAPAKKSISDVNVEDPQTVADDTKTYADLNADQTIINLVIDAINKALGLTRNQVTSADFELTNAQTGTDKQVAGTAVEFIVTAKDSSSIIKDNFKFIDTLAAPAKKSISDVNVEDPQTVADDTKTYADLNADQTIINLVIDAINKALGLTRNQVTSADFELTNAQTGTDKQVAGTAVEFIVTAKDSSSIIKDNFKFIDTLAAPAKKSISDVNVEDPQTVADDTKTYADLNADQTIINLVIDAINKALGLTRNQVTSADFELTNTQTGTDKQVAGTAVEFIVTAKDSSSIIKDNFKFIDTLAAPAKKVFLIN
ncbi:spiralin repeat-containing protein [Spiroplasma chrysopicola]|uniref:Uncharacterized protein n=1 Tax=Spiroplasma chrysopicola DF-1 TaxID=1276227 RepID=R4U0W0_9MOLU|nr:spiralin repeat-containing protein [Spiroplasma chrysopicola]AGM24932.1 hypothetical protein SCHRY_v1c03470 [Spiroplasma chrysopicola DF-1]